MKLLIGIIGEKGGGKGTFTNIFKEISGLSPACIKSSDVLVDTLNMWGIPLTRINLQHLAIIMDGEYGKGSLSTAVKNRIAQTKEEIVFFEGIRWSTDVELLRSFPNNIFVYVTASAENRFERMKKRKEKIGEGDMSWEQFMKEEQEQTEIYIPDLAKQADVVVQNDGSEAEFKKAVTDFYTQKIKILRG